MSTTASTYLPDWLPEFSSFDYGNYLEHEQSIIKPALEHLGYTNIFFQTAQQDSFGPLARTVWYTDPITGEQRQAWYG